MRWLGCSFAIAAIGCVSSPEMTPAVDGGEADAPEACTGSRTVAVGFGACVVDCVGVLHCVDGDLAPIVAPPLPPLRSAVVSRAGTGRLQVTGISDDGRLLAAEPPLPGAPMVVVELTGPTLVELVAGDSHVCGREAEGSVWCWGRNDAGQLGPKVDDVRGTDTPRKVTELATAAELLSAGGFSTCAATGGTTQCWGQLGGPDGRVDTVTILASAVEISSGGIEGTSATCVRTAAGEIRSARTCRRRRGHSDWSPTPTRQRARSRPKAPSRAGAARSTTRTTATSIRRPRPACGSIAWCTSRPARRSAASPPTAMSRAGGARAGLRSHA